MAAEHKAAFERVEHELKDLQELYENLEGELQEKQEEVELYHAQLQTGDSSKLLEQIKELKDEIQQVEIEKGDLEDQIESLQRDAAQLIEKDSKVARERSDERKTLQNVIALMKGIDSRKLRSCKFNYKRPSRKGNTLSHNIRKRFISEREILIPGCSYGGPIERCGATKSQFEETN